MHNYNTIEELLRQGFAFLLEAVEAFKAAEAALKEAHLGLKEAQGVARLRSLLTEGETPPSVKEAREALAGARARAEEARKALEEARAKAAEKAARVLGDQDLDMGVKIQVLEWLQGHGVQVDVPREVLEAMYLQDEQERAARQARRQARRLFKRALAALKGRRWSQAHRLLKRAGPAAEELGDEYRRALKAAEAALEAAEAARRARWWARAAEPDEMEGLCIYIGPRDGRGLPAWAAVGRPGKPPAMAYGAVPFEVCPEEAGQVDLDLAEAIARRARALARRRRQARDAHLRALRLDGKPKARRPEAGEAQAEGDLGTVGVALLKAALANPEAAQGLVA